MATEAGLSIKERLAMLQANNSSNPHLSGPMKASTLPGPHKTSLPVSASPSAPTDEHNNKPNGPATPAKPFVGVLKPAAKPATNDAGEGKDSAQPAFKLRPTGAQVDRKGVTPPLLPNKPKTSVGTGVTSPVAKFGSPAIGGGASPAVAKKPNESHAAPLVPKKLGAGASQDPVSTAPVMRDKSDSSSSSSEPRRLSSIKDRMAALKEKAGEGNVSTPKPSHAYSKTPEPAPKKFPVVPQKTGSTMVGGGGGAVKPVDLAKSIQEAAKRKKASDTFLRHSDGMRFHKVSAASVVASGAAPPKPAQINNVDLTTFLQAYASAKETKLAADAAKGDTVDVAAAAADGEMDELHVEAESTSVHLRIRGKGSIKRAGSVRVSEIPEFTEEEEDQELYVDSQSAEASVANIPEVPEEEYDDCASAAAAVTQLQNQRQSEVFEDPDEIYEPLDEDLNSPPPPEPAPSPVPADDKKAKKEKEKEKEGKGAKKKDKVKDEANKKEEKERKKREDEIKKQRSKFGLKETDEKVGDGVVKNSAGAGVFTKDLAVSKGEIIAILRMDNNPAGKWLVQNEQAKLGFVSSNNIEVATPAIRQDGGETPTPKTMMASGDTGDDDDPEELYQVLPEGEMDDIYEEL
ncbi:hypothetical protein ACOMHN_064848 [Nucella lapillus]